MCKRTPLVDCESCGWAGQGPLSSPIFHSLSPEVTATEKIVGLMNEPKIGGSAA